MTLNQLKERHMLREKLFNDLNRLELPVDDVEVEFRPFSKTYFGNYLPGKNKIFLYPYKNRFGELMDYSEIIKVAIHEFTHHLQYCDPSFVRLKGVMHNAQFWSMYNNTIDHAKQLGIEI